ncbi:hypothetical protein HG531_006121 [Fusarium graminearum]|nr:hypothetical protein HG531_006121 [Fusarium graminearum]
MIGGDRNRISLIVQEAQGKTRSDNLSIFHIRHSTDVVSFGSKFRSNGLNKSFDAICSDNLHAMHSTGGCLELKGEGEFFRELMLKDIGEDRAGRGFHANVRGRISWSDSVVETITDHIWGFGGVQARGNDSKNDILAGENTRNSTLILNQDSSCTILLHELSSLSNRGSHADGGGGNTVKHGFQSRSGHLAAQSFNVLNDLLRLGRTQLRLNTLESIVKLSGRRVGTLKLFHSIVKTLGDIQHARNVLVLVHNWQMAEALSNHKIQGIGGAGVGSSAKGILGHNFGDSDSGGLGSSSYNTERKILGGENTSNSVVIVGNQNAILSLCCHQLGGLGNSSVGLDLESLAGLQGKNSSGRSFARMASSACEVLLLGEIIFELLSNSLDQRKIQSRQAVWARGQDEEY